MNQACEGGVAVSTADRQAIYAQDDDAISLERANRHSRHIVATDIQLAVAKDLHARRPAIAS